MYSKLSDEQRRIVECPHDRHAIVRAVAGSGKSTVLVERLARLFEVHRVPAHEILAVMFNKDAAVQLSERLFKRMQTKANTPASLTYHGLGTQLINQLVHAGKAPAWRFMPAPDEAVRFTMRVLDPLFKANEIKRRRKVAELFQGFVDRIKGDMVSAETMFNSDPDLDESLRWFIQGYRIYEQQRQKQGLRFFSDLIYDPLQIIKADAEAARLVANRYQHIVVDEYQDICEAQQQLVEAVAGTRAKLMVVGDDDQTIYTWRGAKPDYILNGFAKIYQNPIEFQLSRTWRYGHALSIAANYVISNNRVRAPKLCISGANAKRTVIRLHIENPTEDEQNGVLLPHIEYWLKQPDAQLSDIAVLFRTYGRSGKAQLELLNAGIPFRMAGPPTSVIFQNLWVTYLLTWFRLAAGDFAAQPFAGEPDSTSVNQVMQLVSPTWISELTWDQSRSLATGLLKSPEAKRTVPAFIQRNPGMYTGLQSKLMDFAVVWDFVRNLSKHKHESGGLLPPRMRHITFDSAASLLRFVYQHFSIEGVIARRSGSKSAAEDNVQLVEALANYIEGKNQSVEEALSHIQHLINFSERSLEALDAITLTSVHRSKGLEWPCVIMPALRHGWFPYARGIKSGETCPFTSEEIEDERRLFYVAMTRACNRLVMIAPPDPGFINATTHGSFESPPNIEHTNNASQFLYEMNFAAAMATATMIYKGAVDTEALGTLRGPDLALDYLAKI